jgi:hypothetical protein
VCSLYVVSRGAAKASRMLNCAITITGINTADLTERQLTEDAVKAAADGTVLALTKKPLASDTAVAEGIMSFDFSSTLAKAAFTSTEDSTAAHERITSVINTSPRILVARIAEHDHELYRKAMVQLLLDADLKQQLITAAIAATLDMSK